MAVLRKELANAIRILSMDAVEKAKSGHPGAPMGMADIAQVLWNDYMKYNPANPKWANRDRFVLSNGHGSMLLYSLLHLTGFDLSIEEIKRFRQLNSKTAGHPEYGYADGIETTTGPLGQGIANAVGFALAERTLAATFNKKGYDVVNHYSYVFMGDGCLMEGISHESCALAGTLGLGKLIAFWDDNDISIDGNITDWMERDVAGRFNAYDWHVMRVDGHNPDEIKRAIIEAKSTLDKPSIICCKTVIAEGAPNKRGTHHTHGAPLGEKECNATREALGWHYPPFEIPEEIKNAWDHKEQGAQDERNWQKIFTAYEKAYPVLAQEFKRRMAGELPKDFVEKMDDYIKKTQQEMPKLATRQSSQKAIEVIGSILPELFGGSADLTGSNLTSWSGSIHINHDIKAGNYISYGVREFGMAHIMNGMVLHGGFRVYGGTFLMFMEFMRNALRMSALMKIPTIYVYTHDSIGLGEDGPTHQPIEQLATVRIIPNMIMWRPCDASESAVAWKMALLRRNGPTALVFSRQILAPMSRTQNQVSHIEQGGYILKDCKIKPELIMITTGSEVEITMLAADMLAKKGRAVRVVSMPSTNVFDMQDKTYQDSVLLPGVKRMAIEAGVSDIWAKYVGLDGGIVGIDTFGESAPASDLFKAFGFTADNIFSRAEQII